MELHDLEPERAIFRDVWRDLIQGKCRTLARHGISGMWMFPK